MSAKSIDAVHTDPDVDDLLVWFESAAIAHGYAHDTGRAKYADDFLSDLNKIVNQAKKLRKSMGSASIEITQFICHRPIWLTH